MLGKVQRVEDKLSEHRIKLLDLINNRMCQKNEGRTCTIVVDEAMHEYYQVLGKQIKPLSTESQT